MPRPSVQQQRTTVGISRECPEPWPRGPEISFCLTIDHCRTILYYTALFQDLASGRRTVGSSHYYSGPAASPGPQTLTLVELIDAIYLRKLPISEPCTGILKRVSVTCSKVSVDPTAGWMSVAMIWQVLLRTRCSLACL